MVIQTCHSDSSLEAATLQNDRCERPANSGATTLQWRIQGGFQGCIHKPPAPEKFLKNRVFWQKFEFGNHLCLFWNHPCNFGNLLKMKM